MVNIFHQLLKNENERSVKFVPASIIFLLVFSLTVQVSWKSFKGETQTYRKTLSKPPSKIESQLFGLGDSIAVSKILMLWLQAFDNQPGISLPLESLDYPQVINWLRHILILDPKGQYPLLAAARIYSVVEDNNKKRQMLEFIEEQFYKDPNRRWPSMMHAIYVAKHRMEDYPLALRFAKATAEKVTLEDVPPWVKQMEIYVLEDMGEIESAKILIGGLLASGVITDTHELQFLKNRLEKLENDNLFIE